MAEDRGPASAPRGGAFELLLTPGEKDAFSEWSPDGGASFLGGWSLLPVHWLAAKVPENLSPSVLFLVGALIFVEAWYYDEAFAEKTPAFSALIGTAALLTWWCLGEVARVHGQREFLDTPLVQFFGQVSCLVTSVFIASAFCPVFGGPWRHSRWCAVQTVQLCSIWFSYESLMRGDRRPWSPSPGALILVVLVVLVLSGDIGVGVATHLKSLAGWYTLPLIAVCAVSSRALFLPSGGHRRTRRVLLVTLAFRGTAYLLRAALSTICFRCAGTASEIICDGLFMTVLSSDLLLANMAGRELHPAIAVASAVLVIPNLPIVALLLAAAYYVFVFADLATYLDMPLFGVCRNVYCDGIYDLCHIGHKNLFRRASKLGNRLFVGVVGDKDANEYKRPPVMSAAEREVEVASCKGVTKVIANAPCFGLTEEFIRKHRIHVVAYGQEYRDRFPDPDDDPYYKVPRKLGIAVPLPRTECFSTSELLERIRKVEEADLKKKSPT